MKRTIKLFNAFLIFLFSLLLIGCSEEGGTTPKNEIAPTSIEIYLVNGGKTTTYNYGDQIQLAIDVDPMNASYDVKWTSSDKNIARVDDNGLVSIVGSGEFTITATSKLDESVSDEWSKKAYDNRADLAHINDVKSYFDYLYPDGYEVNGVIELPREYAGCTITWTSSNPEVLSNTGLYCRGEEDVTVKLTAKISYGRSLDTWEKDIKVGNINDMQKKILTTGKVVMMYVYSGMHSYTKYELENVDIINHAFALINTSTHKLETRDIEASVKEIIKARSYGIRVCLSIGGWGADGFSQACSNEENRAIFIQSIIDTVKKYGYDGVDLDWEYPTSGSAGIAHQTKDKANFTALVKELRDALNKVRPGLLLTAAVASGTSYYEIKNLDPYLNYWNLMTYDFSSKSTGSTAKYDESLTDTTRSVESYINAGASKEKIIVGVTFRATKFMVSDLGSNYGIGQKMQANRVDVDYKDLVKTYMTDSKYEYHYDSNNGMAVLYSTSKVNGYYEVLAYNDNSAMQAKGRLVKTKGLGGLMAWDLSMDSTNNEILKMTVGAIR